MQFRHLLETGSTERQKVVSLHFDAFWQSYGTSVTMAAGGIGALAMWSVKPPLLCLSRLPKASALIIKPPLPPLLCHPSFVRSYPIKVLADRRKLILWTSGLLGVEMGGTAQALALVSIHSHTVAVLKPP